MHFNDKSRDSVLVVRMRIVAACLLRYKFNLPFEIQMCIVQ
jgi:hypothetical protein